MGRKPKPKKEAFAIVKRPRKVLSMEIPPPREDGFPESQGVAELPKMTHEEKVAFQNFLLYSTQDVKELNVGDFKKQPIISSDRTAKNDHLHIHKIELVKNTTNGAWEIGEVKTNQGDFALGESHQASLNQEMLRGFAMYLKAVFEEDLLKYLKSEET